MAAASCAPAAEPCGSEGEAPQKRRRGLGGQRLADTVEGLLSDQQAADMAKHVDELLADIKGVPGLLEACRSLSTKMKKRLGDETLKRGVRNLETVPDKFRQIALAQMAGIDPSFFVNSPPEDNHALFIWALGGNEKYRLPRLMMPQREFFKWCLDQHAAN
eukprot:753376-Lingulodinium_polyedra.AAC.1